MANDYKFKHNGKEYSVPAFTELPMGVIRKARKGKDEADVAFLILENVMGEDSPELAAVDNMKAPEFQAWLEGWTQGASVGESASSES
jgi:hypothetical protein